MPATIEDARTSSELFDIHTQGFQLVTAPTTHRAFDDERAIEGVYYDEVTTLVKNISGAKSVFVFDHTVRRGEAQSRRKPAHHIHNDYTEQTACSRAEEGLGEVEFAKMKGRRMIQVNVWRPLVDVVRCSPLALCDATSINPKDLIRTQIHFPDTERW